LGSVAASNGVVTWSTPWASFGVQGSLQQAFARGKRSRPLHVRMIGRLQLVGHPTSMIIYERNRWFNAVFSWRGTALRRAKWRVLSMTVYAGIIQVAYEAGVSLGGIKFKNFFGLDPGQHAVLGALLGFLI